MRDYHAHLVPEQFYHIYNRGNNGDNLFVNDGNYEFFLKKWKEYIFPHLHIYAYCLMPNHFHFLVKIKDEATFTKLSNLTKLLKFSKVGDDLDINKFLEERFQRFFSSYALAFNKQQGRSGSLFEKRFKRVNVNSDAYFTKLIHYIHNNPIHHHFTTDYKTWKYCSYKAFLSLKRTLIERKTVLEWFGSIEDFIEFHDQMIDYGKIEDLLIDSNFTKPRR